MEYNQEYASDYVVIVKTGDPGSHIPLVVGFGPFKVYEDAVRFVDQYYAGEPVIVDIVPLNAVLPSSTTYDDIEFVPDTSNKVVDINVVKINFKSDKKH